MPIWRSGDRFEFLGLPFETPRVLTEVVGSGVELVLVAGQRRPAQIGTWPRQVSTSP